MKTKEELNALKEEVETLNKKPHELTDEELEQVSGGGYVTDIDPNGKSTYPNGTDFLFFEKLYFLFLCHCLSLNGI